MREKLRLRQLEALHALSQKGTVSRAADELGISQPATSRLLTDLSTELGFTLYHRKEGRLILTQEARYLLPEIKRVLESMQYISEMGRDIPLRQAGHLRVACLPGFATSHLPELVSKFLKNRTDVTVTIEPDRPERILEWIIGEQYDCGITDGFEEHPAVESRMISVRSVCVFPKGHPLEALETITPSDLLGEKMIHDRKDSPFYRAVVDAFASTGDTFKSIVETRQFTCACELVSHGTGVSIVSELDAKSYETRGVSFRPFLPDVAHQLSLLRPIHKPPSLLTLEFLSMFEESLAEFRTGTL
ncbi:MAG: LysR substrate-binding domain-containing protein [Roseobacter sp.]